MGHASGSLIFFWFPWLAYHKLRGKTALRARPFTPWRPRTAQLRVGDPTAGPSISIRPRISPGSIRPWRVLLSMGRWHVASTLVATRETLFVCVCGHICHSHEIFRRDATRLIPALWAGKVPFEIVSAQTNIGHKCKQEHKRNRSTSGSEHLSHKGRVPKHALRVGPFFTYPRADNASITWPCRVTFLEKKHQSMLVGPVFTNSRPENAYKMVWPGCTPEEN